VLLELGYSDLGVVAANHHVCPIHPAYAEVPPAVYDPDAAAALMEEAGMADFEHELVSLDDDYQRNTCDALAAQLRDAGIPVRRTVLPGSTYWNDWNNFGFSATEWNGRPLAIQNLILAYRSGEPWNETAFSNQEFDDLLAQAYAIADADTRRDVMAKMEKIIQDSGIIVQPYWRSTFRHMTTDVNGLVMHPTFEIHLEKTWLST
jgi:peptide/nickel transport system substrate-binding protein